MARPRTASAAPTVLPTTRCPRAQTIARRGPAQALPPMVATVALMHRKETRRPTIAATRRKLAQTSRPPARIQRRAAATAAVPPHVPAVVQQLPTPAAVGPRMGVVAVLTGIAEISTLHKGPRLFKGAGLFFHIPCIPFRFGARLQNSLGGLLRLALAMACLIP